MDPQRCPGLMSDCQIERPFESLENVVWFDFKHEIAERADVVGVLPGAHSRRNHAQVTTPMPSRWSPLSALTRDHNPTADYF